MAKVLKARYYKNSSFLEIGLGHYPSHIWQSLLWGQEILEKGLIWRIGDGQPIRSFKDNWVPDKINVCVYSPVSLDINLKVLKLINPSGSWRTNVVHQSFLEVEVNLACKINIGGIDRNDKLA